MNKRKPTISDEVLNKIKHGDIKMKPRVYFSILSVLAVMAILASSLAISFMLSIVFFWIKIETSSTMAYGARRNLSEAIASFPWWAIIASITLVFLAVTLVRRYGTMYRHKASTITLALIVLSLLIGLIMFVSGVGEFGNGTRHDNPDATRRGRGWQQIE